MNELFSPLTIGTLKMANRTVRSATWEGMADEEGFVRPELIRLLAQLAQSHVGLIISGYLYVHPDGRGLPWQTGIWKDAHVEGLSRLVEAVRLQGAPIVAQIAHAGGRTRRETIEERTPLAPSPIEEMAFGVTPKELSIEEIQTLVASFGKAAYRAKAAGFDGVQLHAAHCYLISQFLSPFFNRRQDEYGGSPAKRRRFLIEVYEAVRAAVGNNYPILIKINSTDGIEGGITVQETLDATRELAAHGLAAVEISGGMAGSGEHRPSRKKINRPSQEAYFREAARILKRELDIPVILVGGLKSIEVIEDVLASGDADAVSMSRPFICEPDLVERWESGDGAKAKCVSCNLCLGEGLSGKGIRCVGLTGTGNKK